MKKQDNAIKKTKICKKCKEKKNITKFFKDKYLKDGYESKCKLCRKKYKDSIQESVIKSNQKYYINNREKILNAGKMYDKNNYEKVKKYKKNYQNSKYKTDIKYRITKILRSRLYDALIDKGGLKIVSSLDLIGCNISECKLYIANV